jgi:hypothetical protein
MSQPQNKSYEIFQGLMILLIMHCVSGGIIFLLGFIVGSIVGGYSVLSVWIGGSLGFLLIQLVYVIPLVLRFKRQGKIARMKGVIIGAVITALLNGACFLSFYR